MSAEDRDVYVVNVTVSMYVLAKSHEEAENVANTFNPRDAMEADLVGAEVGNWSSYKIKRQDAYMRSRCVNDE